MAPSLDLRHLARILLLAALQAAPVHSQTTPPGESKPTAPSEADPDRILAELERICGDATYAESLSTDTLSDFVFCVCEVIQEPSDANLNDQQKTRFRTNLDRLMSLTNRMHENRAERLLLSVARFRLFEMDTVGARIALDRIGQDCPDLEEFLVFRIVTRVMLETLEGNSDAAMSEIRNGLGKARGPADRGEFLVLRCNLLIERGLADVALEDIRSLRELVGELRESKELWADEKLLSAAQCFATGDVARARRYLESDGWLEQSPGARAIRDAYAAAADVSRSIHGSEVRLEAALNDPLLHDSFRSAIAVRLARIAWEERRDVERARELLVRAGAFAPAAVTLESEICLAQESDTGVIMRQLSMQAEIVDEMMRAWSSVPELQSGTAFLQFDDRRRALQVLLRLRMKAQPGEDGIAAAFTDLLRAQSQSSLARRHQLGAVTLEAVRNMLGPDGCGIAYLPSKLGIDCFYIDADRLEWFGSDEVEILDQTIGHFKSRLELLVAQQSDSKADADAFEAEKDAELLGKILLPDAMRERLRTRNAVFVTGSSLLQDLPFEAVALGGGTPLGVSHAVQSLGSIPLGVWLAASKVGSSEPGVSLAAVLAPENWDFSGAALPEFDASEVTRILGRPPGLTDLLGERCTPAALTELLAHSAGLVHIFAHGVDRETNAHGGIALESGSLFPESLPTDSISGVIFLSSCSASRRSFRPGDDDAVGSTAGCFLLAGARAVIAPTFDVSLASQVALASRFHLAYRASASPAESLRRARLEAAGDNRAARLAFCTVRLFGFGN